MQIIVVENPAVGVSRAKEILYEKVDKKTALFLSGGNTPKNLYESLANEKIITPGAVGMVDERYGKKFHENSNELMIKKTGFLDYLSSRNIPFYPILQKNISREETATLYDKNVRDLFFNFHSSVAVMGIGKDGHTSSIGPNRKNFKNPMFGLEKKNIFVGEFNDTKSEYGERVGLTFAGLSLIDFFIVLIFGKEKKDVFKKMLADGPLEEIPSRFFVHDVPQKVVFITDQQA